MKTKTEVTMALILRAHALTVGGQRMATNWSRLTQPSVERQSAEKPVPPTKPGGGSVSTVRHSPDHRRSTMKKTILATVSLLALLAATSAFAQPTLSIADIPFSFYVGANKLPAGHYEVDAIASSAGMMLLRFRCKDHHAVSFVLTMRVQRNQTPTQGELVFHKYGTSYFLWQVWSPGRDQGHELRQSKIEGEMARKASPVQLASIPGRQR